MSDLPFLDGAHVRGGELPVEISMEPRLAGAPFAYETVVSDDADGFFAVWACDAGVYPRVKDRRGSFMYILEGDATITDQDGTQHLLTADSVIVLPYGWAGQWDIRKTIRKVYVHTTPVPPFRAGVQPSVFGTEPGLIFDGPDGQCLLHNVPAGPEVVPDDGRARFLYVISGAGSVGSRQLAAGDVLALPSGWSGVIEVTAPMRRFDVLTSGSLGEDQ
ncbi:cupin domain-containing protein [Paractinoplanes durhamensis]|uniref:(S)-ureidoglycine aminohydrolase cupin domain-containing protein n=1 Tax=Paractinoplanes durhamensis TaxID=113563 RepID=A0ABQ3YUN9_9ACTN|nr:cupin domain-containing protein [Actinoplanes durhamensis]GIE01293.1 hypothetical protein Adu01nite_26430 [Actinoplanes durhamensis]